MKWAKLQILLEVMAQLLFLPWDSTAEPIHHTNLLSVRGQAIITTNVGPKYKLLALGRICVLLPWPLVRITTSLMRVLCERLKFKEGVTPTKRVEEKTYCVYKDI